MRRICIQKRGVSRVVTRRISMTYPETIIYTEKERIACNGDFGDDHPKVWLPVPRKGFVACGYCDTKYTRDDNFKDYTHTYDSE